MLVVPRSIPIQIPGRDFRSSSVGLVGCGVLVS